MKYMNFGEFVRCNFDVRNQDLDYLRTASRRLQKPGPVSVTELLRISIATIERVGGNLLLPSLNDEADEAARNTRLAYGIKPGRGVDRSVLAIQMPPEFYTRVHGLNNVLGYEFEEQTIVYSGMVHAKTVHEQL